MAYVDGFLLPLARKHVAGYQKLSKKAGKIWKQHGALDYKESLSDDIAKEGFASFAKAAGCKKNELVVFAFIVYRNRKHRDAVNRKVMKDPRIQAMCDGSDVPFDPSRMAYGGFQVFVNP